MIDNIRAVVGAVKEEKGRIYSLITLITVGIGPKKTMIQHECPCWSPHNSHALLRNFHKPRYTSVRGTNKPNETLHVDNANEGGGCAIHFTLFKSPTLNYYTTSIIHSGT